jgi:hypothetical protein
VTEPWVDSTPVREGRATRTFTRVAPSGTLLGMPKFVATMSYELSQSTPVDARKLLRAELVGRRWQDRCQGMLMPANTVWIERSSGSGETVDHVHAACAKDLHTAVAAVAATGRSITLLRVWVHVSGAGTYGLAPVARDP